MNRLLWSILVLTLLLGCEPMQPPDRFVNVKFDYTNLSVPSKYLLSPLPSSFIPSKGMDKDSGGVSLRLPLEDLNYNFGTGIGFRYVLHLSTAPLSNIHSPNQLPSFILNAWNGLGAYKSRIIEFDETVQLYRVYANEYKRTWEYFKSHPSSTKLSIEEWVAGCNLSVTTTDLTDFSSITCKTFFLYKDIHVKMTFSGEYLHLMEEFEKKVKELFSSWEQ